MLARGKGRTHATESRLTYKPVDAIWKSVHLEDHREGKLPVMQTEFE